jgi:hypothetical protein
VAGFYNRYDPYNFLSFKNGLFGRPNFIIKDVRYTPVTGGKGFAVLSKSEYNKLAYNTIVIIGVKSLDKESAQHFALHFDRQSMKSAPPPILIPVKKLWKKVGARIPAAVWINTGIALWKFFDKVTDVKAIEAEAKKINLMISEGGSFVLTHTLVRDTRHGDLLLVSVLYNVQLGAEERTYLICQELFTVRAEG